MTLLKHVDLCSGIGGFALGFRMAQLSNPILFCDIEPWCRKILTQHWPDVPIYEDVKEIANDPERFIPRRPDILTAGYPCQPFSVAGRRKGEKDDRHIWPEIFSIIQSRRPTWTIFENVRGHITMGLDSVLADLEGEGYSTRTFIVPAIGVDAPHKRDRVWIVSRNSEEIGMAHTEGNVSDGIRREADQESDRGNARMESECSRDRQFVPRPSSTMADSRCIDQGGEEKSEWPSGDSSGRSLGSDSRSESEDGLPRTRTNLADTESQQSSSSNNRGEPREVSQSEQIQSGGSGGWSDVAATAHNGLKRGFSETCNEDASGQNSQIEWATNTENSVGQSDDGRNKKEPRVDEGLSGLPDAGASEFTRTTGVRGVSQVSDNHQGLGSQNENQENHGGALVQERQGWIQSSIDRGLGKDQATFENNQIRSGDDNGDLKRMDFKRSDVADTESIGVQGLWSSGEQVAHSHEGQTLSMCPSEGARKGLWPTEPNVGRVANGIPNRVDRIKGLGNAIVPQIAYRIGLCIKEAETD